MSLLRDLLLIRIQTIFERRIATCDISTQDLVVEFGAKHLLVDGGSLNSERPTEQSIFIALISWIVNKKIAFEGKKKQKKNNGHIQFIPVKPHIDEIKSHAPLEWLTHPKASKFLGVAKPTFLKLVNKFRVLFASFFPEEKYFLRDGAADQSGSQRAFAKYNPLFVGLIKFHWLQGRQVASEEDKTTNELAQKYGADRGTITEIINKNIAEDPSLGFFGSRGKRKRTFFCTSRLVAIIEKAMSYECLPQFAISNYKWQTYGEIVRLLENLGYRVKESFVRKIAEKQVLAHPEWVVPFKLQNKREADYCHPLLVKNIIEKITNNVVVKDSSGVL